MLSAGAVTIEPQALGVRRRPGGRATAELLQPLAQASVRVARARARRLSRALRVSSVRPELRGWLQLEAAGRASPAPAELGALLPERVVRLQARVVVPREAVLGRAAKVLAVVRVQVALVQLAAAVRLRRVQEERLLVRAARPRVLVAWRAAAHPRAACSQR